MKRVIGLMTAALAASLVLATSASALTQELVAGGGGAGSAVGTAVAVEDNTAVVGASKLNAAFIFTRSGDSWNQTAVLRSPQTAPSAFGTSVAIEGQTVAVGAPATSVGGTANQGAIYTFEKAGGAVWQQTATLTASDGVEFDLLGVAVAMDGSSIVASGNPLNEIPVYTFAATGDADRQETAKLSPSSPDGSARFGASLAVDGDTVVVGAPQAGAGQGVVYTFASTGAATRQETATLQASDGLKSSLGESVAIDGGTIVAGAPTYPAPQPGGPANQGQGALYTFTATGSATRFETARLLAPDGAKDGALGISVDLDGGTIVAGATLPPIAPGVPERGAVYRFGGSGAGSAEKLGESDGNLGYRVAVDGATVIAGKPTADIDGVTDRGAAIAFFGSGSGSPAPPGGGSPGGGSPGGGQSNPPGSSGDGSGNSSSGGGGPDLTIAAKRKQRLGKAIVVRVKCDEACSLKAKGKLKLAGAKKKARLRNVRTKAAANTFTKLRLKVSRKTRKKIRTTNAKRGVAKIRIKAKDEDGNSARTRVKVKLRRR